MACLHMHEVKHGERMERKYDKLHQAQAQDNAHVHTHGCIPLKDVVQLEIQLFHRV